MLESGLEHHLSLCVTLRLFALYEQIQQATKIQWELSESLLDYAEAMYDREGVSEGVKPALYRATIRYHARVEQLVTSYDGLEAVLQSLLDGNCDER